MRGFPGEVPPRGVLGDVVMGEDVPGGGSGERHSGVRELRQGVPLVRREGSLGRSAQVGEAPGELQEGALMRGAPGRALGVQLSSLWARALRARAPQSAKVKTLPPSQGIVPTRSGSGCFHCPLPPEGWNHGSGGLVRHTRIPRHSLPPPISFGQGVSRAGRPVPAGNCVLAVLHWLPEWHARAADAGI